MKSPSEVIRIALEDGRYKPEATIVELCQGKIEFMCQLVQELGNEEKVEWPEEDATINAIRQAIGGRFTLCEWLIDQLNKDPSKQDYLNFWEEFINAHS